jgi:hypothetical protein
LRLLDLQPEWLALTSEREFRRLEAAGVDIRQPDGIKFLCPKCFAANGGPKGTHAVICWRPSVPQTVPPRPGRWEFQGTGFADLSLVAGSSSVLLKGGCNAHFFVRSGQIVMT